MIALFCDGAPRICVICGFSWGMSAEIRNPKSEIQNGWVGGSSIGWLGGDYNPPMPYRCRRVPADLSLNRLAAARERIGAIPYDLTISNPTSCGISYPSDLFAALSNPRGLAYEPDPRGPMAARNVVAAGYKRWGATPNPRRIVLTASTSEAYGFLFRLFLSLIHI